ncbi:hypothetical protein CB1_000340003 [Camelus ferus]|nr:hypothetical protein CB1_000340003 [Camelus ferus]
MIVSKFVCSEVQSLCYNFLSFGFRDDLMDLSAFRVGKGQEDLYTIEPITACRGAGTSRDRGEPQRLGSPTSPDLTHSEPLLPNQRRFKGNRHGSQVHRSWGGHSMGYGVEMKSNAFSAISLRKNDLFNRLKYCEYMPDVAKCRQWLEKNFPNEFAKLTVDSFHEAQPLKQHSHCQCLDKNPQLWCDENSPKQETGISEGQGTAGEEEEKKKQKREIDLKEAQRFFAQKFSCGASVTGEDEIIIQGDFTDDIIDVIQEKWPEVDDDSIEDLGEVKNDLRVEELSYKPFYREVLENIGSEVEISTIEKQRKELQLLIGELKDRDKELNDMVAVHQRQLLSWEEDRQKVLTLEERCSKLEAPTVSIAAKLRVLVKDKDIIEAVNHIADCSGKFKLLEHALRDAKMVETCIVKEKQDYKQKLKLAVAALGFVATGASVSVACAREHLINARIRKPDG